jgi:ABC-type lipoprotein export system ATPase subunit
MHLSAKQSPIFLILCVILFYSACRTNKVENQATPTPIPTSIVAAEPTYEVKRGTEQEVAVLRGVNLEIQSGQFIALKGRSGSGKTTLLNILGGVDRPTEGTVRIFNQDISRLNDKDITIWRREKVGFIFQSFGLTPTFSAYENVELMLRIAGEDSRTRRDRSRFCLDLVGLTKRMNHRPDELSGGQQQRVAIARALANNPKLILADEPTGELDSTTAREILNLFQRIVKEEHITMLMASHDPLVDGYVDII